MPFECALEHGHINICILLKIVLVQSTHKFVGFDLLIAFSHLYLHRPFYVSLTETLYLLPLTLVLEVQKTLYQ